MLNFLKATGVVKLNSYWLKDLERHYCNEKRVSEKAVGTRIKKFLKVTGLTSFRRIFQKVCILTFENP
jgi:hypothetical protein